MAEPNPTMVIADCIEKSKATTDQELIGEYIAETLGVLQTDNTEEDAFDMLGSAIVDEVADDPARTEALFEGSALRSTLGALSAQLLHACPDRRKIVGDARSGHVSSVFLWS